MGSTAATERSPSPGEADYWRGLFKVGGLLMLMGGILAIVDLLVGAFIGGEPIGLNLTTEQLLQYIEAHRALYMFDETLLSLLVIPLMASGPALALALYFSVKDLKRRYVYYIVLSLGIGVATGALFLAASTAPLGLVPLADKYAAATSDTQRAIYVTAAEAVNVLDNDFFPFLVSSIGIILLGIPMRKSVFGRGIGYLGIATGIVGLVVIPLGGILSIIWQMLVGYKLYKLGQADFPWRK